MAAPSKYDQLRAMREARYETKSVSSRRVTKDDVSWAVAEAEFIAEVRAKTGRPQVHASSAAKQRAYRERKRHADG
jgi:hypothetical protein